MQQRYATVVPYLTARIANCLLPGLCNKSASNGLGQKHTMLKHGITIGTVLLFHGLMQLISVMSDYCLTKFLCISFSSKHVC